jgi:hypothetical protein
MLMHKWCKRLEFVLTESGELPTEYKDILPGAEALKELM